MRPLVNTHETSFYVETFCDETQTPSTNIESTDFLRGKLTFVCLHIRSRAQREIHLNGQLRSLHVTPALSMWKVDP